MQTIATWVSIPLGCKEYWCFEEVQMTRCSVVWFMPHTCFVYQHCFCICRSVQYLGYEKHPHGTQQGANYSTVNSECSLRPQKEVVAGWHRVKVTKVKDSVPVLATPSRVIPHARLPVVVLVLVSHTLVWMWFVLCQSVHTHTHS